jgi:cytochrome c553
MASWFINRGRNVLGGGRFATAFVHIARFALLALMAGSALAGSSQAERVAWGKKLFTQETFAGNGRTCATCHPADNNFTLDAAYIARLPANNPLFVAEFNPALRKGFENPRLMREFALIQENLDGFDDLENRFVMRSVPHTLAMGQSVASPDGPRTGWSGDGAPGDHSLRAFATGAVIQHFTKTLNRVPGVDFRLPTDAELDAIEAYTLSLGRQEDLNLPLPLKGGAARRGQSVFLDNGLGKCNLCHINAGANANVIGTPLGNANFDTGVENLPDIPPRQIGEKMPRDDGFGRPGNGFFNTPPLVEAADTPPFFHNNAVLTLEGAVDFYNTQAFKESLAGRTLASLDPKGVGISLDAGQVQDVAAFLRVLNALENIRQSRVLLEEGNQAVAVSYLSMPGSFAEAAKETGDALNVLGEVGLHPQAQGHLRSARFWSQWAGFLFFLAPPLANMAQYELNQARLDLIEPATPVLQLVHGRAP